MASEPAAMEEYYSRLRCVGRILAARNQRVGAVLRREDLEDLCQDVQCTIWEQLALYRGAGPIEAWVHRYCDHAFRNAVRKRLRNRLPGASHELDSIAVTVRQPSSLHDPLSRCMQRLTEQDQWILHRKFFDEVTLEGIAAEIGSKLNTLKSRYVRALTQLQQCLGGRAEP
ncbi:MAG: sigma-70 family RNA polymerase sigma factor [Planctomycetota bacterium]